MDGAVLAQGLSRPIVIVGVAPKNPAQMSFTRDYNAVETLPPDRADQTLGKCVLPW